MAGEKQIAPVKNIECVHKLFETQVERTPNAVALVYSKGAVSYRELDYQANWVAIQLRSLSVGPEVPVAILRAGGACLAVDSDSPKARLAFMDSGAPVLSTQRSLAGHFQFQIPNCREVCLESLRR